MEAVMQFTIQPHRGIGPVSLGMSREEVAAAMAKVGGGSPVARNEKTDCFFRNAFQLTFGDAGRADFIEVCAGITAEVMFDGRDVFDTPADELVALIQQHDRPDPELSHPPDDYISPKVILSLWGPEEQYDYKGGELRPIFATVGVGGPTYLAAIQAFHRRRANR